MKQHTIPELEALLPADDETVAHMAEKYPVLSNADQERIYQMSERKYRMKAGDLTMYEMPVTPEEALECQPMEVQTKRSYRVLLETAACLLLVVGVIGGVVFPLRRQLQQGGTESVLPIVTDITTDSSLQTSATTAPIQTTTETATTSEALTGAALEAQMKSTVIPEALRALKNVDELCCSGLPGGESIVRNGWEYFKTELWEDLPIAHNTAGIRSYMQSCMTDQLIAKRYPNLLDGDAPAFLDHNNQLYTIPGTFWGVDYGVDYTDFTFELKQKDTEAGGAADFCSIKLKEESWEYVDCQVDLILVDGIWKLDAVNTTLKKNLYVPPVLSNDPEEIVNTLLQEKDSVDCDLFMGTSMLDPINRRSTLETAEWTDTDGSKQISKYYVVWFLVKDSRYSTMAELNQYYRTHFTENYLSNQRNGNDFGAFREFDGALYTRVAYGKGWHSDDWSGTTAEVLEQTDTKLVVKKISVDLEVEGDPAIITCIKEADGWKFDKMEWGR